MSRHLHYLNHLFAKLKDRYGEDDESVRQIGLELKSVEDSESRHQALHARARRDMSNSAQPSAPPVS